MTRYSQVALNFSTLITKQNIPATECWAVLRLFGAALLLMLVCCNAVPVKAAVEPETVAAQTSAIEVSRVEIGIKGIYKTGFWVPCRAFFNGELPENAVVTLFSLDPDGTPTRFLAEIGGDRTQATALIRVGRENAALSVRVETAGNAASTSSTSDTPNEAAALQNLRFLTERVFQPRQMTGENTEAANGFFPLPVPIERPVYLTLAAGDMGIESAFAHMALRDNNQPVLVPLDSLNDLPDDAMALRMVSLIALSANPDLYEGITLDNPKLRVLKRWLQLGGCAIFNAGRNSEPLVSGDSALFADFLPGKFERMASLRLSSPYEVYISQFQHTTITPINMTGSAESPFIETPAFSEPRGVVEASDMDLPLIVRVPMGLGSLVYMGGDLDQAPIRNWRDRPLLVAKLLGVRERTTQSREHFGSQAIVQLGYNDLAGQLRSALDQFENVKGISFTFVMILLVVYLFCVGIGDWLLVHKLLKRPQLTWLTFPCWVVLFVAIAVLIAKQTQVDDMVANQAELIDIDLESGTARGTAWVGLFSPQVQFRDLRFETNTNAQAPTTRFAWFGLSGSGLGGMSPQTVSLAQWNTAYTIGSPGDVIARLPMQTRSTRSLTANWSATNYENLPIVADLTEQEGIPCGHVMNASPHDLTQCFVVYGRWVIELNEIKAGAVVEVNTSGKRRDLRTVFTGGQNIFSEGRSVGRQASGRYNTESVNIPYILRSMMFYQASGDLDEFGLSNAYERSVDMSNLLPIRRAVLISMVAESENGDANTSPKFGSRILQTVNNVEQPLDIAKRVTFLRVVMPVKNDGRGDSLR